MPIQALSIFACLPEKQALEYLQNQTCLSRQVCSTKLVQARSKYGKPMSRVGHPEIRDIPSQYASYLNEVKNNPRFVETIGNGNISYSFQFVEIDPLLAFQFHISLEHTTEKLAEIDSEPTIAQMLQECLPLEVDDVHPDEVSWHKVGSNVLGVTLSFQGLSARLHGEPQIIPVPQQKLLMIAGPFIGVGSPLVQVAVFEGRYYLKNGYHRAYRLRKSGMTYIPALLIEAKNEDDIGITQSGFLPMSVLKSNNPPTVGHFTNDRAYPIPIKRLKRRLHISWQETLDEDA